MLRHPDGTHFDLISLWFLRFSTGLAGLGIDLVDFGKLVYSLMVPNSLVIEAAAAYSSPLNRPV